MYSGTTFRVKSGRLMGAHQRIDRIARRSVSRVMAPGGLFPDSKTILHFEGKNGPDGIKSKSPSQDEPWHFIDPADPNDHALYDLAHDHSVNLAQALRDTNPSRAGFEAAWLAHTITDGLTPAHHYPLAKKIEELWGKPHTERSSLTDKNIIKGTSRRDSIHKNWQYWGVKGVFTTHVLFELGYANAISLYHFGTIVPSDDELERVRRGEFMSLFDEAVHEVYDRHMYEQFYKYGWTSRLGQESRDFLTPIIVKTIVLGWYAALCEAGAV